MTALDARTVPADPTSRDALAARGLDYRVVEADDLADHLRAEHRGFLGDEPTEAEVADDLRTHAERRVIGVYDAASPQPYPVATECAWVTPLSVPGGEIDMWAISGVTVAATHRRRGIARGMLEGDLRAAKDAGLAIAGLTATEATIYGRYGFAPAAPVAHVSVDARRAGWGTTDPAASLEFVERAELARDLSELHERTRTARAGDVGAWPRRWEQKAGLTPDVDKPRQVRGVRALDATGALVGALAFRVVETAEYHNHTLRIEHLVAATPDAHAALWRFALSYDLVGTVEAPLQPVDDALGWLVRDRRAITRRVHDHGWLRILDVPRALAARELVGAFGVRLAVTDPLGLADGAWTVARLGAEGARIEPLAEGQTAEVTLDVGALSAAYLGGVRLETLQAAGHVTGDPAKIRALSDALSARRAPHLSIWY
ncbi:GNAT family N-acetyltransferase [Microbacterium excoecariae]|uniref:GNAT family N-acetyltransferase n=1 Tax=Microbacterium excoecariae TaxID=2715210 RepID=UPI0014087666|nr:GNAT family N-acetyltransferase [Microbacterium excoecariae]